VEQNDNPDVYKKRIKSLEKALETTANLLACLNIDEEDIKRHNLVSNHVEKCRSLLSTGNKIN
jgi:hypothetical protein